METSDLKNIQVAQSTSVKGTNPLESLNSLEGDKMENNLKLFFNVDENFKFEVDRYVNSNYKIKEITCLTFGNFSKID